MVVPLELDPGRYDPRSPYYEPPASDQRAIQAAEEKLEWDKEQARAKAQKRSPDHYREREAWAAERWWQRRKEERDA